MANILFVYGTLMQGMRNHVYLEKAKFLGAAQTGPEYELRYNGSIPAARAGSEHIVGELYEVDDETLAGLDVLEEVSNRLYEKKETTIDGKKAIIYLGGNIFNSDTWETIPGGDYHKIAEAQQKTA
jgi:gamma-glutamylcyclotransferase (GGCT)/AIG2-like uncharacterized protein YtfP